MLRLPSRGVRGDEEVTDALDVERRVVSARLAYQIDTLDEGVGEHT